MRILYCLKFEPIALLKIYNEFIIETFKKNINLNNS